MTSWRVRLRKILVREPGDRERRRLERESIRLTPGEYTAAAGFGVAGGRVSIDVARHFLDRSRLSPWLPAWAMLAVACFGVALRAELRRIRARRAGSAGTPCAQPSADPPPARSTRRPTP